MVVQSRSQKAFKIGARLASIFFVTIGLMPPSAHSETNPPVKTRLQAEQCTTCYRQKAGRNFSTAHQTASEVAEAAEKAMGIDPRKPRTWLSPISNGQCRIGDGYGSRIHPITHRRRLHAGQDLPAKEGTKIVAPADGVITEVAHLRGYGNQIRIKIGANEVSFSHLRHFEKHLRKGMKVRAGETVGYVGHTGMTTGPHLHYELRVNGIREAPITAKKDRRTGKLRTSKNSAFTPNQLCGPNARTTER